MDRGIDTGAVVAAAGYPALQLDISDHPRPDDATLYRAIFSFYDPILRAVLLVDKVLGNGSNLSDLPAVSQGAARGVTFISCIQCSAERRRAHFHKRCELGGISRFSRHHLWRRTSVAAAVFEQTSRLHVRGDVHHGGYLRA